MFAHLEKKVQIAPGTWIKPSLVWGIFPCPCGRRCGKTYVLLAGVGMVQVMAAPFEVEEALGLVPPVPDYIDPDTGEMKWKST